MKPHASRPPAPGQRIPARTDLRAAPAADNRIPDQDGRAPMFEAGALPPLPIRPLPEPPARRRPWARSARVPR